MSPGKGNSNDNEKFLVDMSRFKMKAYHGVYLAPESYYSEEELP